MSAKVYTHNQLLWYKAGYGIILNHIQKKIDKSVRKKKNKNKEAAWELKWRLAFNLYCSGKCIEADTFFSELLISKSHKKSKEEEKNLYHGMSRVYQIAGRNSFYLFHQTKLHYHLENAHKYYQLATEHMHINLSTMILFPKLLLEFGYVLEAYGSFEAAMEIYGRILKNFPTFKGYFDTLYRTALVGKHVADLMPIESTKREETIKKSIDILHFLLEALPTTIIDYHAVLLYARTLEASSHSQVRYSAKTVYVSLCTLCRKKKLFDAHINKDVDSWLRDENTWSSMANAISAEGEPLIANEAYKRSIEEHRSKSEGMSTKGGGLDGIVVDPVKAAKGIAVCLKVAKHFAAYHNYVEAITYAEKALDINKYNKETRTLLSQWSEYHKAELEEQSDAVARILDVWKGRCWTKGFCRRVKDNIVRKMESKIERHPYNHEVRNTLSYYSRDQWRAKFIFEDICATRIQVMFREKRAMWIFQDAARQAQFSKTTEIYRLYLKSPWERVNRHAVLDVTKHRLTPKKHQIHLVKSLIEKQNSAMEMLEKAMRAYSMRKALQLRIDTKKNKERRMLFIAASTIQHAVRMRIKRKKEEMMALEFAMCGAAAVTIQRFVRWRRKQFKYIAKRQMDILAFRKKHAWETLILLVPPEVKRFLKNKRQITIRRQRSLLIKNQKEEAQRLAAVRELSAVRIQRFFRGFVNDFWLKIARRVNWYRKKSSRRPNLTPAAKVIYDDSKYMYKVPGISQNSTQFIKLASQPVVKISGKDFGSADCQMLSLVLKHKSCMIKHLIFDHVGGANNASFEFDLLPSIAKCKTIRKVTIVAGNWAPGFLFGLIHTAQIDNPRIVEVGLHCIENSVSLAEDLSLCTGRLLMDYFNYSIPGMQQLCLHSCSITDRHLDLLSQGLSVNSSLLTLVLSMNFVSDEGVVKLLTGLSKNKRSALQCLDLSINYIRCGTIVRGLLDSYEPPFVTSHLKILLLHNSLNEYYIPQSQDPMKPKGLTIIYFDEAEAALILKKAAESAAAEAARAKAIEAQLKSRKSSSQQATTTSGAQSSFMLTHDDILLAEGKSKSNTNSNNNTDADDYNGSHVGIETCPTNSGATGRRRLCNNTNSTPQDGRANHLLLSRDSSHGSSNASSSSSIGAAHRIHNALQFSDITSFSPSAMSSSTSSSKHHQQLDHPVEVDRPSSVPTDLTCPETSVYRSSSSSSSSSFDRGMSNKNASSSCSSSVRMSVSFGGVDDDVNAPSFPVSTTGRASNSSNNNNNKGDDDDDDGAILKGNNNHIKNRVGSSAGSSGSPSTKRFIVSAAAASSSKTSVNSSRSGDGVVSESGTSDTSANKSLVNRVKDSAAEDKGHHRYPGKAHRNTRGKLIGIHQLVPLAQARADLIKEGKAEDYDYDEEEDDYFDAMNINKSNNAPPLGYFQQMFPAQLPVGSSRNSSRSGSGSSRGGVTSSKSFTQSNKQYASPSSSSRHTSMRHRAGQTRDAAAVAAIMGWSTIKYN